MAPDKRGVSGSRTPAAERRDRLVRAPGRPRLVAGVLLAGLVASPSLARAADGGVSVPVAAAILFPADAPLDPVDAGPGVYLPEDLAIATANELAGYRAAPPQTAPSPTGRTVAIVFLVGLGLGAIAGVAFGVWAATR